MTKRFKLWLTACFALAAALLAGGIVYTSLTAAENSRYVYTQAEITEINSVENADGTYDITGVTIRYETEKGTVGVLLEKGLPAELKTGAEISVRYLKTDPAKPSTQRTDWFSPAFLIALGVMYSAIGAAMLLVRKRAGHYAMTNPAPAPADEDEPAE